MHLSAEQVLRYQTSLDSLFRYADGQLGVTCPLSPRDTDRLYAERLQLVARELWRHPDVFDGFVAANPDGLSERCLGTAGAWRDGLACRCVITGYDEQDNAIVESDAGTFVVRGLALEPADVLGELPLAARMTLVPLDDAIVFGVPLAGFGRPRDGEIAHMRATAASSGFAGMVTTADELRARAAVYQCAREDRVRARQEAAAARGGIGAGFHRGRLAGMGSDRRLALAERNLDESSICTSDADLPPSWGDRVAAGPAPAPAADAERQEIARIVEACVLLRGVVSLADAYGQYVVLSADPIPRCRFEDVVVGDANLPECGYGLWEYDDVRYVVAPLLSDVGALACAMGVLSREGVGTGDVGPSAHVDTLVLDDDGRAELSSLMEGELSRMGNICEGLLNSQVMGDLRPVERRMVEQGMTARFLRMDAVVALRDFLDAHIPDGQDDERFADRVVIDVANLLVTSTADTEAAYDWLGHLGLWRCEGTDWSDTLGRLVVNLYNALPRWERGGWSLRQIRERLTGHCEHYAADGSVMRADDDGPCGSGPSCDG